MLHEIVGLFSDKSVYEYALTAIITALLTVAATLFNVNPWILFGVIAIGGVLILYTLIIKYYANLKKNTAGEFEKFQRCIDDHNSELKRIVEDYNDRDITMKFILKKITLSKKQLDERVCSMKHEYHIENHMKSPYCEHLLWGESNQPLPIQKLDSNGLPSLEQYDFKIDGECIRNKDQIPREIYISSKHCQCRESPISISGECKTNCLSDALYGCKIRIPVNVDPGKICKLQIFEKNTSCFENLFNYNKSGEGVRDTESISVKVNHPTERLAIEAKVDDELYELGFRFTKSNNLDEGEIEFIRIYDASNQRMANHEKLLRDRGCVPQFSGSKMTWIIDNPKVGYRYKVYFRLYR